MRSRTNAVLATLQRVQRFLIEYAAQLLSAVDLLVARQRLDEVIANLTGHAFDQDAKQRSAKGETEKQKQFRFKIRTEQMKPIAEVARRHLRAVPEFKALQMPPRSAKGGAFVASAKAMAAAAELYKPSLLERGLPADFLDQFKSALATLEDSIGAREQRRIERMGATRGLSFAEQEGRSLLKVLDASVRRALAGNEALLRTWEGARVIYEASGGTAKQAPQTTETTTSGLPGSAANAANAANAAPPTTATAA